MAKPNTYVQLKAAQKQIAELSYRQEMMKGFTLQQSLDMAQIALIKCYQAKKPFADEQHIRRWLIRVTVNECKRYLVSPWRRYTAPLEDYAETLGFETPEQSALFFAVMELPQKYRVPVHLYYYEDYSVREIAEALGLRESAVQTRLLRARQKLRQKLEGWNDD